MAIIYYNSKKGKLCMDGMYLKLAYAPLPAKLPAWVGRAQVAHSNALENLVRLDAART